jgi:putative DNA-invertase from lambdoid prophage Rac
MSFSLPSPTSFTPGIEPSSSSRGRNSLPSVKAAVYLRVSDPSQDVANQLPALEEYIKRRGWELVKVYSETESAWVGGHQRELAVALQDARRGRFSYLIVWALDRLSREGPRVILTLVHQLAEYGCQVVSLQEAWTETPGGAMTELLLSLTGWVAQYESRRRSERTKAGMAKARANGAAIGKRGPDKKKRRKRSAQIPICGPDRAA